jgi:hypothetical protein
MTLFKNGNKSLVSNYRPISLLSCVGKTFERVVFKHVSNYFLDNKLLCKYQSGFVPGCSTVHQLIEIFNLGGLQLLSSKFDMEQKKLFRRLHLSISSTYKISFSVSKRGGIVQLRPTLPISFLTRDQNYRKIFRVCPRVYPNKNNYNTRP